MTGAQDEAGSVATAALHGIVDVSRETSERLAVFVELLKRWQPVQNLVAPATLPDVWRRHVADSAQVFALSPKPAIWADFGSGAGFPGLVTGILLAESGSGRVHLVESNRRKCAFLREAIRATGARAEVHSARVEDVTPSLAGEVTRISARALAPLVTLLDLAEPLLEAGAVAFFHKGRDVSAEIELATKSWGNDLLIHKGRIGEDGVILEIGNARRLARV